ncbi:MAG TPA: NEW3 domain-containing protein [Gemmatimonadaceae bacterium]|nr:NEW3 domain-containing protein [Gemmatimonadaceae bacterium]
MALASRGLLAQNAERPSLAVGVDTTKLAIEPGAAFTMRVTVRDQASADHDALLTTKIPTGWQLLSAPTKLHVKAGGRAVQLVQIVVPHDAAAGDYEVLHSVRAPGLDTDLVARSTVSVRVRRNLTVTLIDQPYFAASGTTSHATFLVSNHGNIVTRVHLRISAEREISAHVDQIGELKPGESKVSDVVFDAGELFGEQEASRHIKLIAEPDGGLSSDNDTSPQAVAAVRVVARGNDAGQPWHTLPLSLDLSTIQTQRYQSATNTSSLNYKLSGFGPIAEGSKTTVDFLARGPQSSSSPFGERAEYRIGLTGENFLVRAGDQLFRLTPLTEAGAFSSGLNGSVSHGSLIVGAMANRQRWFHDGSTEQAGFIGFNPSQLLSISGNVLRGSEFDGTLGSLYFRSVVAKRNVFEMERAQGLFGIGSKTSATLARAAGDHGWVAFDLRHFWADSAYRGGTGDRGQDFASLAVRPTQWFRVAAQIAGNTLDSPYNLSIFNDLRSRSHVEHDASITLDIAGLITAGVRRFYAPTTPTLGDPNTNGTENSGWVRIAKSFGRLMLAGSVEQGTLTKNAELIPRPFSVTRVQTALRLSSSMTVSGFVERSTGQRIFAPNAQTAVSAGATASLQIHSLTLGASANAAPSSRFHVLPDSNWMIPGATASIDGNAALTLSGGRRLQLEVRVASSGPGRPVASVARLSYNVPLRLPIGRSRSTGRVVGRVYDGESHAGVANALVRVGDRMGLTDDQGFVTFGSMAPNKYPVFVDLGEYQVGGSGLANDAQEISPTPGRTTTIDLRVTRMGRVVGRIDLYERIESAALHSDSSGYRLARGLGGIVLRFMNGAEERHAITGPDGTFELHDARPGMWQLIVPTSQLPSQTFVDGDSVRVIDVSPGEQKALELKILPRQRKILPLDAPPAAEPAGSPKPKMPSLAAPITSRPAMSPLTADAIASTPSVARLPAIRPVAPPVIPRAPVAKHATHSLHRGHSVPTRRIARRPTPRAPTDSPVRSPVFAPARSGDHAPADSNAPVAWPFARSTSTFKCTTRWENDGLTCRP